MKGDKQILLVTQKNATDDDPGPDDIYDVGVLATVLQLLKLPDGTVKVLVEGGSARAHRRLHRPGRVLRGRRRRDREERAIPPRPRPCARRGRAVRELREAQQEGAARGPGLDPQIDEPAKLADSIAAHLSVKIADKQQLLELDRVEAPGEGLRPDGGRDLRPAGREEDPLPREAPDGEDPARVLSERADEGDPARAGRDRGRSRRDLPSSRSASRRPSSPRKRATKAEAS